MGYPVKHLLTLRLKLGCGDIECSYAVVTASRRRRISPDVRVHSTCEVTIRLYPFESYGSHQLARHLRVNLVWEFVFLLFRVVLGNLPDEAVILNFLARCACDTSCFPWCAHNVPEEVYVALHNIPGQKLVHPAKCTSSHPAARVLLVTIASCRAPHRSRRFSEYVKATVIICHSTFLFDLYFFDVLLVFSGAPFSTHCFLVRFGHTTIHAFNL